MGKEEFEIVQKRRQEDLFVYFALAHFRKFPPKSKLSPSLQEDIRIFFGSYREAKELGKKLLYQIPNPQNIIKSCKNSHIGKLLPDDLYVHIDYINELAPILRVYVGCADIFFGQEIDANIVKIHMKSSKLSYLVYKDFDKDPHPRLMKVTKVHFIERYIQIIDFSERENPPILHRKETMVGEDYKYYRKFKKLTESEERHGLYEEAFRIGTKQKWEERLVEKKLTLKGHRLVKLKK